MRAIPVVAGLVVVLAAAVVVALLWPRREAPPAPGAAVPAPTPSPARRSIVFHDTAEAAGLNVPHFNAADGRFRLVETMGSGVGLIDFDDDGRLDIFVAQGCPLPLDPAQQEFSARLYHNNGNGAFADVTAAAGVGFNGYGQGVAVGDYDGDGRDDLFLAGFGRSALYHNNGDGTFTDATDRSGVRGGGWPTSCAFADLDGDRDLDLYVVHYLADTVDDQGRPTVNCNATPGRIGYCPPGAFAPEADVLYRNNGDGTFTDISAESGIGAVAGNGLGLAIADLDDDGRLDIFVANDQSPNYLFHNQGGLRFEETALSWGLAYDESGRSRAGMGVACGDYDDDGRPDLLVTNFFEEGDTLYRNVAPGVFQVTTARAGLSVPSRAVLGFGVGFEDFDLDGELDLLSVNGHINDVRPLGMPYAMRPQVFRNRGTGRFEDVSGGAGDYFQQEWLGRAAAFGDIDNDGDPDAVVTHLGRPPALLRNDTPGGSHYLSVDLEASGVGRRPVGASVTVRVGERSRTRQLAAGTSYLAAGSPRLCFGLGKSAGVDELTVRWPGGKSQTWTDLAGDRVLLLREGEESPAVR